MAGKRLKKASDYFWLMFFLVSVHVVVMKYLLPREWADTQIALQLVNAVATVIPAIRVIQEQAPPESNYWCLFYATFWLMSPIYALLGYQYTLNLKPERYRKLIEEVSAARVLGLMVMVLLAGIIFILIPMRGFGAIDQMHDFLPRQILAWFVTAGIPFMLAHYVCVWRQKSKLAKQYR